ncbi:MAG: 6-phosphogluconolactonase [Candidatus Goldiibacteriota bacterium]|jgi:6-phosphogluconolactonase
MKKTVKYFKNLGVLSKAAAVFIAKFAASEIKKKGYFTMAVSGGDAPVMTYRLLSKSKMDWKKIFVFWQDDRFVNYDERYSNVKLVFDSMITPAKIPYNMIFPVPAPEFAPTPAKAALSYELIIKRIFSRLQPSSKIPRLDLIIAGVGPDGHTASLFPGDKKALGEKRRLVINVSAPKTAVVKQRVTMTLPLINGCSTLLYIISGKGKAALMKEILKGNKKYPAALTKAKKETAWFIDREI